MKNFIARNHRSRFPIGMKGVQAAARCRIVRRYADDITFLGTSGTRDTTRDNGDRSGGVSTATNSRRIPISRTPYPPRVRRFLCFLVYGNGQSSCARQSDRRIRARKFLDAPPPGRTACRPRELTGIHRPRRCFVDLVSSTRCQGRAFPR